MSDTRKLLKGTCIVGIILIAAMLFCVDPVFAGSGSWGKTTHIGNYYFKFNLNNNRVYISKKKSSGFKKTPVDDRLFVSNGKQMIYSSYDGADFYLRSYDISKKKDTKLKKLPVKVDNWAIRGAKGNYIWIDGEDGDEVWLYRYNIKTKKLKKYGGAAFLRRLYGNYYFCEFGNSKEYKYRDPYGVETNYATKAYICTLTNNGKIKKIRSLGYFCDVEDHYFYYIDNWGSIKTLYYTKNKSHDLYRVRYDGKKLIKVRSFDGYVVQVNKKSCKVADRKKYKTYKY